MPVSFDPFGTMLRSQEQESLIRARDTQTSFTLFEMQQKLDEAKREREYMRRTTPQTQAPAQPGQPQMPGQQQQRSQTSASDMILGEVNALEQKIGIAANLGLNSRVDQLTKMREAAMSRYSLAVQREDLAKDRIEKERKEKIASVSRFASGANAIMDDEKTSAEDKLSSLQELEDAIRDESPQAYKVLSGNKGKIDWSDPRTFARMKALEQQAVSPEKRTELALSKNRADEQKRRDDVRERQQDALIALSRERVSLAERKEAREAGGSSNTGSDGKPIPKDLHGEAYLNALPEDDRGLIKGIAEGRIDPKTLSVRGGHREAILKKVAQYRPDFNQAKYQIYAAVQKDFTSGVASRNVTAINTAIHHMGTMSELATALENKDTRIVNAITNKIASETGDPRINNYKIAASAVSNELMRVFRQVGAATTEIKDWEEKFSAIDSPAQLQEAIRTGGKLLRGRIKEVDKQWKRGMDSEEGFPNLLSPDAEKILRNLGVQVRDEPKSEGKKEGPQSLDDFLKSKGY